MTDRPAVVIYAALSKGSDDPGQASLESQIEAVRARVAQLYPDGCDVIGEYDDDGYSGSKANRGPGLQAAIDAAVRTADDRGACELWANTSARFGRGTGKRDEARAIGALFYDLRARGVQLRAVVDDELVSNEMLVSIGSTIAAKYSADLSESIKRAKLRQLDRGDHLGGPVCDGYRIVAEHDDAGDVIGRSFAHDPVRKPLLRLIFRLASEGVPDGVIARRLNAEGHRTRHGRPFTRRAVQNTITNPWYAGRVAYKRGTPDEQVVDGNHPPLIEPAEWNRIQAMRAVRDHAAPHEKVIGRPAQNHALARLAVCGRCGERLYAVTSTYRRTDGTRARSYVCHAYKFATGTCDAKPISAEVVDAAVIAGLDTLLVDFDAWRNRIQNGRDDERQRLTRELERAQNARDCQANKVDAVEAKWSEYVATGDGAKADAVLKIVQREQQALREAETRVEATVDALATVPIEAPADAMLDFANALQAAISGRLERTGSMAEVNRALRELFTAFSIHEDHGPTPFGGGIMVQPWLRPGAIAPPSDPDTGWPWPALVRPEDDAPPMRWLSTPTSDPERNATNSHA